MKSLLIAAAAAVCLSFSAAPAMAQANSPKPAEVEAKPKRKMTPGQIAAKERQKACAGEWKKDKAAGKTAGQTWPKYWSACNKRLKAARA